MFAGLLKISIANNPRMRYFFIKTASMAVLLFCLDFAAAAQSVADNSETLFAINNRRVSLEEFVYLYKKNHQNKSEEFTEEKIEEYLDLFIKYKLKVEEALFRGMDTTAKFRKEYQS